MGRVLAALVVCLLSMGATAFGKAYRNDPCLNHCSLERGEDGRIDVLCSCLEKKFSGKVDNIFALRTRSPEKFTQEVSARLHGASEAEQRLTGENSCQQTVREFRTEVRPANEFIHLAGLAQRPLCECVRNRVHFPIQRECEVTKAGVLQCRYGLERSESQRAGPVRDATLNDYQSCIAERLNYRKPFTCSGVVCRDLPHDCPFGKELVNVADSESCCPIFECRTGEGS